MNPEDKKVLNETLRLAKENNRMLHKMRTAQKWAKFTKILYWIVIIAIAAGIYYYLEPVVDSIRDAYQDVSGSIGEVKEIGDKLPF